MNGVNKVILVGNMGMDPVYTRLDNGASKARLRMATTETYRNSQGERFDRTEWHTIILWRGLADLAEKYLRKGSRIYVEGKLRTRQVTGQDGSKRNITEVEAENLVMLDRRQEGSPGPLQNTKEPYAYGAPEDDVIPPAADNDLPFDPSAGPELGAPNY
jgi:single-strand DNA-binding protein